MLDSDTLIDVTRRMKSLKIENDRRLSRYENEQNEQNERKKIITMTINEIKLTMNVDLCFVLDCTSSMEPYIEASKDCILNVFTYLKNTNPSISIRVGFCGYRDYYDDVQFQHLNFTESYDEFRNYIKNSVNAIGGGDIPEDVLGGLDASVREMSWSHHTRVILHICDAPPHGRRYSSLKDDFPRGDPNRLTAESVFHKMKSKNILYSFGKITDYTSQMINVFQRIIGKFPVFDVALDNDPETLLQKFIKAVTSTVTSSVSLNSKIASTMNSLNIYSINESKLKVNPREPNWADLPKLNGLILEYFLPTNVNVIKDPEHFRKSKMRSIIFSFKIAPYPFDRGAERSAFFGFDLTREERMVLKKYYNGDNSISRHLESSEISIIAYFLAEEFNSACEKNNVKKKIKFIYSRVVTVDNTENHYSMEFLLNREYKKFNNNAGVITELHSTLEAFTHFTYNFTDKYLAVCDLQGIEHGNEFWLTDPAIHCVDISRFGNTNFGKEGIDEFILKNHNCNSICKKLNLF